MNIRDELIQELISAKVPSPRLEADIIIKHTAPMYPEITAEQEEKIKAFLERRIKHEPLDKIIGEKEFYKYRFKVSSDVLSPRPDTEILVEEALGVIPCEKPCRILDLGTGSGCILLTLLKECPLAQGVGVDISATALSIAKDNAQKLAINERVELINKSWNDVIFTNEIFDVIVSNPPYIEHEEINKLEPEVKNYDPLVALDGGIDGLMCYREIASLANLWLKENGYILLEVGYNQSEAVADIFQKTGLKLIKIAKDLANINRCVILRK